ncbi:MAG: cytochrome c3 family protein [Chlorobi bacterium]|nr:cytochrome c3 family protein [Chlorobiota bacterium]
MPQIFPRSANATARASILGSLLLIGGFLFFLDSFNRSNYQTNQSLEIVQPVMFEHTRHVAGNGLDCRYCHTSVEESHFAGIPPVETCMTCHSQILKGAPILQPVRNSYEMGAPLEWVRVHDLGDFVYFNHSIHIAKGMACVTCHGHVDEMALMWQENTLQMQWCLDCHRAPEKYIRPREHVFDLDWEPEGDQIAMGDSLVEAYNINVGQLTNCSICHR